MRQLLRGAAVAAALACATVSVASEWVRVKVARANVRKGPDVESAIVATVGEGTVLEVLARQGEWYRVRLPPDAEGYLFAPLAELQEAAAPPQEEPAESTTPAEAAPRAPAGAPAIDHAPVACIVAEHHARFDACLEAPAGISRARVNFRTTGTPFWYYVEMSKEGACHTGIIPKPRKDTKQVDYYVSAVDTAFSESRTQDYSPIVVRKAVECKDRMTAAAVSTASVVVGAAPGAPAIPAGFLPGGLAAAGSPAAAAASASSETAEAGTSTAGKAGAGAAGGAAGGGLSIATLGLIAGGAAAAVGVAVAAGGGKDPQEQDNDRDGFTPKAGDCNDSDPQVNPNGPVAFENARFESTTSTCPDGSSNTPVSFVVLADGRNGRCSPVTISNVTVTLTIVAASNVANEAGQSFDFPNQPFTPASLGSASRGTLRVEMAPVCTNPRRNSPGFTEISARLTVNTSAGSFTVQTSNTNRTNFPLRW